MEKLIYPLWMRAGESADGFREQLVDSLGSPSAGCENLRSARLAIADSAVAPARARRLSTVAPLPDAVLSLWVDNAGEREVPEQLFSPHVDKFNSYLVTESEPLVNRLHRAATGTRQFGFCQVVFLQRPPRLTQAQWLSIWQGSHTRVAIETQSTFGYRQNVIVRSLSPDAPAFDAIIEENFPPEAMDSDLAFFAAKNEDELAENQSAMMNSCARFIDFDRIDVIPMSEYLLK